LSRLIEESHRSRRILGQLARGEDLVRGLLSVCQERSVRCGRVEARGVVDEVLLSCYDADNRSMGKPARFRGAMQLLHATGVAAEMGGQLHLELSVVLARQRDNGLEVLGGVTPQARVVGCQFVIEAVDDMILRHGLDRGSGLLEWQQAIVAPAAEDDATDPGTVPVAEPAREESRPGKPSWADAVMASVRASAEAERAQEGSQPDLGPIRPVKVGDFLDHSKFGRCLVQKVDADQEYVTVRLRNSRLVRLNLEVLDLRYTGDEDGHQVFSAAPQGAAS